MSTLTSVKYLPPDKKYVLIGHKSENFEHFLQLALQNMGTMKVVCGNVITMFVQYDSLLLIFSFW